MGASMRVLFALIFVLVGNAAGAQQCQECAVADVCIKDYTRAVTKIKADYKKGVADQRKGREQSLRDRFSPRSAVTDRDGLEQVIRAEIEKLKDCLGKVP
jgi:hypothetical protein